MVTIHTSAALRIAGSVSDTRVGGGLGHPCTATTERSVSYTAGECGNTEAVWPSGPMPSSRTSNDGTGPWSSGRALSASRAAYSSAAASAPDGPVPVSAPIG